MKKIILLVAFSLVITTSFAQKKRTVKSSTSLAKEDNIVAEIKTGNFQLTIDGKDTIVVKLVGAKFTPLDVKLTSFTANGIKLYLLVWTEKTQTKTDVKTEDITTIYSAIYEIASKKMVFYNTQLSNHIVEKVFLDRNKTASETQEKMRREGFEFTLNSDGSITQKNKTQENKLVYDSVKMEYIDIRKKR
jgi:hypothetical protein